MSIQISFKNMRQSEAVKDHVYELFDDLLKITDSKYPFHVDLTQNKDESYHVSLHCSYQHKQVASTAEDRNLYKALSKAVDAIRTQIIRKTEKLRAS
jgi:ribosomal subunit interface protein